MILPSFDPAAAVNAIASEKVNMAVLVPTMIDFVDRYLQANPADMSSLRKLVYGASPISEALLHEEACRTRASGYGPAGWRAPRSCSNPATGRRTGARLLRSRRPTPGTDIRIVDEQMNEVPRAAGEVVARGPSVMLGYWRKPEQTKLPSLTVAAHRRRRLHGRRGSSFWSTRRVNRLRRENVYSAG